jgi:hypothetical protein
VQINTFRDDAVVLDQIFRKSMRPIAIRRLRPVNVCTRTRSTPIAAAALVMDVKRSLVSSTPASTEISGTWRLRDALGRYVYEICGLYDQSSWEPHGKLLYLNVLFVSRAMLAGMRSATPARRVAVAGVTIP